MTALGETIPTTSCMRDIRAQETSCVTGRSLTDPDVKKISKDQ